MPREAMLARTLVELADTLVADFDVVELLTLLADRCVDVLDVDAAGLMLVAPDGDLRVMASSSEAMRVLELFELQAQEGPCLDCYRTGQPVVNQDLATVDGRWPRFVGRSRSPPASTRSTPCRCDCAARSSVRSTCSTSSPGRCDRADIEAAQALADVATIAILQHRAALEAQVLNEQLNHALNSRIVIEQAKGVIAEREGLDMEQAFADVAHPRPQPQPTARRRRPRRHHRELGRGGARSFALSKVKAIVRPRGGSGHRRRTCRVRWRGAGRWRR